MEPGNQSPNREMEQQLPQPERIPQAVPEVGAQVEQGIEQPEPSKEIKGGDQAMALPPVQPVQAPEPPQATPTPVQDEDQVAIGQTPDIADDADVIEKEWVNKAKEIVEKTRDNPHEKKKQVSVLKSDYMKKRYGKTVGLSEDDQ